MGELTTKTKTNYKGFSMMEMLIVLSITVVLITATASIMTSRKGSKDFDNYSVACVKARLGNLTSSECVQSVKNCKYNQYNACKTLAYYADYGTTNYQDAARKVIRETCDQSGEKACDYFFTSCQKNSGTCDITSGNSTDYDLKYYLNLLTNDTNKGALTVGGLGKEYYQMGYPNIQNIVASTCQCPAKSVACFIKGCGSWTISYGGSMDDTGYTSDSLARLMSAGVDSQGYIYVMGFGDSCGTTYYTPEVAKFDSSGNKKWSVSLGTATAAKQPGKMDVDSDGNTYYCILLYDTSYGGYDFGVIKVNSSGIITWAKDIGGSGDDQGITVAVDPSGNVYASGTEASNTTGGHDVGVVKLNSSGAVQWQMRFGTTEDWDAAPDIETDSSGNLYLTGFEYGNVVGNADMFAAMINSTGILQWTTRVGGANDDYGWGIAVDSSGNSYVVGDTKTGLFSGDSLDIILVKFNSSGAVQWQKKYGGLGGENSAREISIDPDGNIWITGYTSGTGIYGNYDIVVLKIDTSGNLLWSSHFGSSAWEEGNSIAVDAANNIYIAGFGNGTYSSPAGRSDFILMKPDTSLTSNFSLSSATSSLSVLSDLRIFKNVTIPLTSTSFKNRTFTMANATCSMLVNTTTGMR